MAPTPVVAGLGGPDSSVAEKFESDPNFDWLERALRDEAAEHRAVHVDDAGFTARVMAALPAPAAQGLALGLPRSNGSVRRLVSRGARSTVNGSIQTCRPCASCRRKVAFQGP